MGNPVGIGQQSSSCRGERRAAAVTMEKRRSERGLQQSHPRGHVRLDSIQGSGSAIHAAEPRYRSENPEISSVHSRPRLEYRKKRYPRSIKIVFPDHSTAVACSDNRATTEVSMRNGQVALQTRLGIAHPIIQAPMGGGASPPELVAAVCNAGGLRSPAPPPLPPQPN